VNPDSVGAIRRAEHLIDINRPREALHALSATLAQEPDNIDALCLAARAEIALANPERARQLAARAAEASPASEWPMRLLALALLQMGQPHEAYQAARGAVANAPHLWQTHHTMAQTCAGTFGMTSVAYAAAGKAIELAPLEPDAHAILGRVALESGDQSTAERALREALRLDPNHAVARNDLGRLQLLRNDHFGAADHFAQAAASDARLDVAADNVDLALTAAVARLFFWVWILLITLGRAALQLDGNSAVGAGLATLAGLIGLVGWQLYRLRPALRGRLGPYLRLLPHRDRKLTGSVAALALAMVALAVMCVLPPDARWPAAIVGVLALIISRVFLATTGRLSTDHRSKKNNDRDEEMF
jgi:Flp pilus assembly protein TadD